ncbi:MAG: hypothetical protein QNJ51_20680 [Calothrix sp. MO_167.B12]|nr:hypothetical protein [Calothrix sp. MO_167.B12]
MNLRIASKPKAAKKDEQPTVTPPSLSKISLEELNKVNAGFGPRIIHIG